MRAVCFAFLLAVPLAASAADDAKLEVGQEAPPFTLKTANPDVYGSKLWALRRFVGPGSKETKKKVVLSFGASYCGPCKKELPELKALAPRLKEAGVELAVVIVDTEAEGRAAMVNLTEKLGLPFAVLTDRFGVLARRYHADQLPLTVVIDGATGNFQWTIVGFKADAIERLEKQLGLKKS